MESGNNPCEQYAINARVLTEVARGELMKNPRNPSLVAGCHLRLHDWDTKSNASGELVSRCRRCGKREYLSPRRRPLPWPML